MRRLQRTSAVWLRRGLVLRPEATLDCDRFPMGFVPLEGSEPIDSVYALVKQGHFVAPLNRIEAIHNAYLGVRSLCRSEFPVVSSQDLVTAQLRENELKSRLLIRRDFWVLEDFNDPELNQSFGAQNLYFDNYKWSQVLWKRFQLFVEEYYPVASHTHLRYSEYVQLIQSFATFEEGIGAAPVLPKGMKLHPPYGVELPTRLSLEPLVLLKRWVGSFRSLLMLHRALVVNAGTGVAAFALKLSGVPMVRGVDSRPRAVAACRSDSARHTAVSTVSFQVAELFPCPTEYPSGERKRGKYDLIVFCPDESVVSFFGTDGSASLSTVELSAYSSRVEEFFERAGEHLSDTGVLAICCTNLYSVVRPKEPHPVEYEVKVNRRYVILDYQDAPVLGKGPLGLRGCDSMISSNSELRRKLRSEIWVLHKLEAIEHFGFFHGIPGAKPPAQVQYRQAKRLMRERQRQMREHVEGMGGDWNEYKQRLITMLQEQNDVPEDDVAVSVRMALDPTYSYELGQRAKAAVEAEAKEVERFHKGVLDAYSDQSPREAFDAKRY